MSVNTNLLLALFYLGLYLSYPLTVQVADDNRLISVISSYNPAAYLTSVTISDFMKACACLGGVSNARIKKMNCKSFSEFPRGKGMMKDILNI